jgi:hypothetical protein
MKSNPWLPLGLANHQGPNPRSMPESSSRTHREFLPSAQLAIAEMEEATGKPVLIVEEPDLNVAATIRWEGADADFFIWDIA